jgi:hypothetical protein
VEVHKVRQAVSILVALVLAFGFCLVAAPVSIYAAITNLTNTPANPIAGANTTDNVAFTTGAALNVLAPADQIIITFPAGFNATATAVSGNTTTPSGSDPILVGATATVVTLNVTANEAAGNFYLILTGIVNHQTAGNYQVTVETQNGVGGTIEGPQLSAAFAIIAGPANQLLVTQQPAGSVSGFPLTTQPGVEARDQFGNLVTTYATNITASENEPGTLTGTLSIAPVGGSANFTDLVYTATADLQVFQIDFNSGALPQATSANVTCNVTATQLVITTQPPAQTTSGSPIPGPIVVAARDAGNVTDVDYVANVIAAENDPGTLTGALSVAPVLGVATFNNLIYTGLVDRERFQVDFTSGALAGATSDNIVCFIPGGGAGAGGGGGIPPASGSGFMDLTLYLNFEGRTITDINLNSTDSRFTMGIPQGTRLLDAQGNPLGDIQVVTLSTPPPPPGYVLVGHAYDCLPDGATFQPAITLTFKYVEADIPAGVSEEDLVLAYWDGNKWVNLTTTVKAALNTASVKVTHFTPFAILAYTGAPAFATSDLSITPAEVDAGDEVTITLLVANNGDGAGSYEVTLEIDDVAVTTKEVTLAAGASEVVTFTTARNVAGTYGVSVGDLSGTFTVKEAAPPAEGAPPEAEEAQSMTGWIVVGVVAAVIVAVVLAIVLGRRRRA